MAHFKALIVSIFVLYFTANVISKIVLPHKLRYLENMLNSEVVAKAAKIRQRIDSNSNAPEIDQKNWPLILSKMDQEDRDEKKSPPLPVPLPPVYKKYNSMYRRNKFN